MRMPNMYYTYRYTLTKSDTYMYIHLRLCQGGYKKKNKKFVGVKLNF